MCARLGYAVSALPMDIGAGAGRLLRGHRHHHHQIAIVQVLRVPQTNSKMFVQCSIGAMVAMCKAMMLMSAAQLILGNGMANGMAEACGQQSNAGRQQASSAAIVLLTTVGRQGLRPSRGLLLMPTMCHLVSGVHSGALTRLWMCFALGATGRCVITTLCKITHARFVLRPLSLVMSKAMERCKS